MKLLHEKSKIIPLTDLDLFSVPPTQMAIEKTYTTEHRPLSTLASTSNIEFQTNSAIDEYINLKDTFLYFKLRVDLKMAPGANCTEAMWKTISPVNGFLNSLFRTVDLEINGVSVTQSPQTYAYK